MCKLIEKPEFGIDEAEPFDSLVENCGYGLVNTQVDPPVADISDLASLSVFCAACKPGYKPTYDAATDIITECQPIPNCNLNSLENTIFNKCKVCLADY
jgi:hypothetical protein